MLMHRMTAYVVSAPGAEQVTRLEDLRSIACCKRDPERFRIGVDGDNLGANLDLGVARGQKEAQDLLGKPLRLAALEFVTAAKAAEDRCA